MTKKTYKELGDILTQSIPGVYFCEPVGGGDAIVAIVSDELNDTNVFAACREVIKAKPELSELMEDVYLHYPTLIYGTEERHFHHSINLMAELPQERKRANYTLQRTGHTIVVYYDDDAIDSAHQD